MEFSSTFLHRLLPHDLGGVEAVFLRFGRKSLVWWWSVE
jgi:hypothetical protein